MPGFDDDDEGTRPPPNPLDRTWLHPSEIFAAARSTPVPSGSDAPVSRSWRRDVALTVTAGTIGAIFAVAALGILGAFEPDRPRPTPTPAASGSTDAAAVADQVVPGIAAVITTVAGTETRGSGIAVGPHEVLTTTAVVGDAVRSVPGTSVEICVANRHRHRATVVGSDPVTGLVLLRVPTLTLAPAPLRSENGLRAGDWVAAIGRSASSGTWVTSGVVTATGGWSADPAGTVHAGMIATNTQLADEARGGALVDRNGTIVGVLALSGTATPADMAADVATQLAARGRASHGSLGIRAADTHAGGAGVVEITPGSSAARAGLQVGDRIVAVDDTRTADSSSLVYGLRRRAAGRQVRLTVVREKHTMTIRAQLDDASGAGTPATAGTQPVSQTTAGPVP